MLLIVIHVSGNPRIIHRDIKSSNILLDYNFDAQVCSALTPSEFDIDCLSFYFNLTLQAFSHSRSQILG